MKIELSVEEFKTLLELWKGLRDHRRKEPVFIAEFEAKTPPS